LNSESSHIENLIARYLAGEASEKEREELFVWMDNHPENKKYFEGIKFVHDKAVASHRIVKVNVDNAWQKLSAQMIQTPTESPVEEKTEEKTSETISLSYYKKAWFRIAASIIIILGLSALAYFTLLPSKKYVETIAFTATDSVSTHKLADNTKVTLNKNSKLVYHSKKNSKKKELELTGEAFIEVHHTADTQLIVKAGETFIRDIGTAFNVKAYPNSSTIEVTVENGEVEFFTSDTKGVTLKAGETGTYDKVKKEFHKLDNVDINAISYKSKHFVFHNTPLNKVLQSLNSVYSDKFKVDNSNLGNCTITVIFDNESPGSIADIIAETLGLQLTNDDNTFLFQGETCSSQP
jgi:ferric-dicitrate binding protein FerR (iron transport regulator)